MEFEMILERVRSEIDSKLAAWAKTRGLETLPLYALEDPPVAIEADVACNLPLLLAKPLKSSPRFLAEELRKFFEGSLPMVETITIAGAGFLNITLKRGVLQSEMKILLKDALHYGRRADSAGQKILIEFVSANPTGPLHVGHGRGAALGDSLALILSHLGYAVTREYYINDAGNQVRMLGESLLARCAEAEGKSVTFPENGYHGDYVKELAREFIAEAPASGRTLEKAISFGVGQLTKAIEKDLEAFGVRFDSWFSEASLLKKGFVDKYLKDLSLKGHVKEEEGALWFVASGEEEDRDKNRVLKKRDGQWTYFATDIAYHADKYDRGYDRLIDIWGADHHGYVPRVKGSMQALGYDATKLHVILNQLVALTRNGVPVVMSKRAGACVTLREVLDEVGKDACRFFFAMRGPNSALDFDLELAKKHTVDNPVYYLQYAHARICSIFRQAEASVRGEPPLHLLVEKEERDLMKRLAFFPHVLGICSQEDSPHPLANYLMQVARQFHYFYDKHRVLGDNPELTQARLGLLSAVRSILALGLGLLGVSAPESM
jgi:arginyl-tRNA synthetase